VTDPIEDYLDALAAGLHGSPAYTRRVVAEAEEHLRDAVDAHMRAGRSRQDAVAAALSDFGSAVTVADRLNGSLWTSSRSAVLGETAETAVRLGAVGMVAVGFAGVGARVLASATSTHAVFGLPTDASPSAAQCTHWLAVHPAATSCRAAAAMEASSDQTSGMLAVGLLGLLLLVVLTAWRRRRPRAASLLPAVLAPTVAATAFGAAGLGLVTLAGSNAMIFATWGRGLWWVSAACSLAGATIAGAVALRRLPTSTVAQPSDGWRPGGD
jgi:MYXO-CTERM domain-containing protein